MKGHPDVEGAVQKLKKFENVVNYVTILDCNYRENDFFFSFKLILLSSL